MKSSAHKFKDNAARALKDGQLKRALDNLDKGLVANRAKALANLPEFDQLRDLGRDIKNRQTPYPMPAVPRSGYGPCGTRPGVA